jgi:hypothetical protein
MSSHLPVSPQPPLLIVGQDLHGRWLVQDRHGLIEGFFRSRETALDFARSESEIHSAEIEISALPLMSRLMH